MNPSTSPRRCFAMVRPRDGRPARCPLPACWHGLLHPPEGGSYRVFSCDDHADGIEDRFPITRVAAADTTPDRVTMLRRR
jgi:hypothetical protein